MVPQLAHLAVVLLAIGSQLVPSVELPSQSQDVRQVMVSVALPLVSLVVQTLQLAQSPVVSPR